MFSEQPADPPSYWCGSMGF